MYLLDIKSYIDCNTVYIDWHVVNIDHTASQCNANAHMVTDGIDQLTEQLYCS